MTTASDDKTTQPVAENKEKEEAVEDEKPVLKQGVYTERENNFRSNLDAQTSEMLVDDAQNTVSPYFRVFSERRNDKILVSDETEDSPEAYLKKVVKKYDVKFDFSAEEYPMVDQKEDDDGAVPWIQGIMRKKIPPSERTGCRKQAYKYKFMRLYGDALLWFEVPSFRKRHGLFGDCTAKPEGILPLALISGVKGPGLAEIMAYAEDPLKEGEAIPDIDDTALTIIELELGKGQGVIKLRAEDWRQRMKWMECLNIAIFDSESKGEVSRVSKLTQDFLKVTKKKNGDRSMDIETIPEHPEEGVVKLASDLFAVVKDKQNTIRAEDFENHELPLI